MGNLKFSDSQDMQMGLEALDYKVEVTTDENFDWLDATSETEPPLLLRVGEGLTVMVTVFAGYDLNALDSRDFLNCLNKVNEETLVTKWYFLETAEPGQFNLAIRSTLREYSRAGFSDFVTAHMREIYERGQDFEPFMK